MKPNYHQLMKAAKQLTDERPVPHRLVNRLREACEQRPVTGAHFSSDIEMTVGVLVTSYDPGKPARMPTPNNPGDPEEPEEIEIEIYNEDGDCITSLVPEDVYQELEEQAAEYMRGGGRRYD